MAKSANISARIDADVKDAAEHVFQKLGLSASQAITLFYVQVGLHQGLPFSIKLPNARTRAAIEEAELEDVGPRFDSTEALFEDLER